MEMDLSKLLLVVAFVVTRTKRDDAYKYHGQDLKKKQCICEFTKPNFVI